MMMNVLDITTISQLPQWLQGDMYVSFNENDADTDTVLLRPIKMDLVFTCLRDVMQMIDTCLYTGVDKFPREIYDFACKNAEKILREMNELEHKRGELVDEYYEFTKTSEYIALQLCCKCYEFTQVDLDENKKLGALLKKAIKNNNIPLVRYCVEDLGYCNLEIVTVVVSNGCIGILEYLLSRYPEWLPSIKWDYYYCNTAANYGNVDMLAYLHETIKSIWTENTIIIALTNFHYDCAIYAIKHGCPIPKNVVYYASVCEKSAKILQCLIEHGNISVDNSHYMNFAMRNGNLEFIKLLYEHGCRPNEDTLNSALFSNNQECIQFATDILAFL